MESADLTEQNVQLKVQNIGGIEETNVTFEPGITILTGRNATNRTSFLQAIMAGLGSNDVSLKGDAERGEVTLKIGDDEYTRTLHRQGQTVQFGGDPYLDDSELADLFAFLLQSNEARRAVGLGDDLRDIMMRPVDADAIQAEIRELKSERDDIDDRIEERKQRKEKLPKLEEQRTSLEEEIEEKETELGAKRDELDDLSTGADEARAEESKLNQKMQTLQQKRSELDTVEFQLNSEQDSLDSLETERENLEAEYEEVATEDVGDVDHIESDISQLREQKQRLENELSKLQNVIQFNEEMLDGTSTDIATALQGDGTEESVTEQLLEESSRVVCWTCGTEVDQEEIEDTLDRLRDLRQSKYSERTDIEDDLSELKEQKQEIKSTERRSQEVKRRLADVRTEIEHREEKIGELESTLTELNDDIDRIQDEIEELEEEDRSEVLEVHREVNELEIELDRLRDEREGVENEIADIESEEDEIESMEERREQITDQLDELRTRVERIETEAIEEFNEHMDTVLDILDFDNLDRIWVERVETETRQGRRKVDTAEFRLHIVRSTEDGVTYEDNFQHLSESERDVTGLVFALAGYLAHEVYEEVPFILLDSLEAIDSERIATLVEYIEEYAEYLVVALLREDAAALDDDHQRITDI